jgi:UDP:flavonoid glycosyltransferase YjiC (YdhE family)
LIKRTKPDIIIRDLFRDLAGIVAKEKGIYDVSQQLASCAPFYSLDFRPHNFPWILDVLIPKKILKSLGKKSRKFVRGKVYKNIRKKALELGIKIDESVPDGFEADLVLLTDDPLLFPFGNLRPNYKYTGAILSFEEGEIPSWKDAFINDKRKKVVITSGSTGVHDKPEIFTDAFKDNKYAVAVYSNNGSFPDSFYGGKTFALQSVLPYADIFITHGGIGSTYLGLQNGVPMLVLPNHFEQQINGNQLKKIGAGISLYPSKISSRSIRTNIEKISQEPAYKQNAIKFSQNMIKDSVSRAVSYIEKGYEKFKKYKK